MRLLIMIQDWVATWPLFVKIAVVVYLAFIAVALQIFLINARYGNYTALTETRLKVWICNMWFLPYMLLQIGITAIFVLAALAFVKVGGENGRTAAEMAAMLISFWQIVAFIDEKIHIF